MLSTLRTYRTRLAPPMAALFALGLLAGGAESGTHGVDSDLDRLPHHPADHAQESVKADASARAGASLVGAPEAPGTRRAPAHEHDPTPERDRQEQEHAHAHGHGDGHGKGLPDGDPVEEAGGAEHEGHHGDAGCNGCACVMAGCSAPALPTASVLSEHPRGTPSGGLRPNASTATSPPPHAIFRPPRS